MENLTCRQAGALDPVVGLAVTSADTDSSGMTSTVRAINVTPAPPPSLAPSLSTHPSPGALDQVVGLAVTSADTDSSGMTSTVCAINVTPAPPPSLAPSPSTHPSPCRTLKFGNGVILEFMEEDIPIPPAISFAENLALLNQMWDDTPPHWQGNSVLTIRGIPIPIVYWKKIYSRLHGEWKGLKSNWSLWKVGPPSFVTYQTYLTTHPDDRYALATRH